MLVQPKFAQGSHAQRDGLDPVHDALVQQPFLSGFTTESFVQEDALDAYLECKTEHPRVQLRFSFLKVSVGERTRNT